MRAILRHTCFGRWLDVLVGVQGGHLFLHYIFYKEVVTQSRSDVEEMVFEIGEYRLTFRKREFCLVNCFHFGDFFAA